jgi:hypothetical protein
VDASRTERDIPDALAELLRTLTAASTIRKLTFNSFKDLHAFQFAVTGFDVKFDGYVFVVTVCITRWMCLLNRWLTNTLQYCLELLHIASPYGGAHLQAMDGQQHSYSNR